MIYPETRWFEIVRYNDKQAAKIANLVEQTWLCIYPRPPIVVYDLKNKLLGQAFKIEYGIKAKFETMANPQSNSILEIIHQVIATLVHTFDLQNSYQDDGDH